MQASTTDVEQSVDTRDYRTDYNTARLPVLKSTDNTFGRFLGPGLLRARLDLPVGFTIV